MSDKMKIEENSLEIEKINQIIENIIQKNQSLKRLCNSNSAKRDFIYLETENEEELTIIATINIKKSELNKKYINKCFESNKSPIIQYIRETYKNS